MYSMLMPTGRPVPIAPVGKGDVTMNVGSGVMSVGNGVGRSTPGVGARVLFVPACTAGIKRRAMDVFIVVWSLCGRMIMEINCDCRLD